MCYRVDFKSVIFLLSFLCLQSAQGEPVKRIHSNAQVCDEIEFIAFDGVGRASHSEKLIPFNYSCSLTLDGVELIGNRQNAISPVIKRSFLSDLVNPGLQNKLNSTFVLNACYGYSQADDRFSQANKSNFHEIEKKNSAGEIRFFSGVFRVSERDGQVEITVSRVNGQAGSVSVFYQTHAKTAIAEEDFQANSGTLSWSDHESGSKIFVIPIVDDEIVEPIESFEIQLTQATGGARVVTSKAKILIEDSTAFEQSERTDFIFSAQKDDLVSSKKYKKSADKIIPSVNNSMAARHEAAGYRRLMYNHSSLWLEKNQVNDNQANQHFFESAFAQGASFSLGENMILGATLDYEETSSHFTYINEGGDVDTFMAALYGRYYLPKQFYLGWVLESELSANHNSQWFNRNHGAKYFYEQSHSVLLSFNKDIEWREWMLSSYMRMEYQQLDVNNYQFYDINQEQSKRSIDQSLYSLTSALGGQLYYHWRQPWGMLTPGAKIEWEHQHMNDYQYNRSYFGTIIKQNSISSLNVDQVKSNYFNLGASISASFSEGRSAYIMYESQLGQGVNSDYAVELGVRIPF